MIISKENRETGIEIDLTGPEGNAFVLMAYARDLGRKLSMKKEEVDYIINRMQRSDYENLVNVFDESFGHIVTLYR